MGLYAHSAYVLLGAHGTIEQADEALASLTGSRRVIKGSYEYDPWVGGDSVMIEEGATGITMVDVVNQAWPDGMGEPESEPLLFIAWATGMFGPSVFPGALERAVSIGRHRVDGARQVYRHVAFFRIRTLGTPSRSNAQRDLTWIAAIADALLKLPDALCFFDPNGEVLLSRELFESRYPAWSQQRSFPLDLWTSVRTLTDLAHPNWEIIDIIGLRRFGFPDHEIVVRKNRFTADDLAAFLSDLGARVLDAREVPGHGEQLVGPDGVNFHARSEVHALGSPVRPVIRWFAMNGDVPPSDFAPTVVGFDGGPAATRLRYSLRA